MIQIASTKQRKTETPSVPPFATPAPYDTAHALPIAYCSVKPFDVCDIEDTTVLTGGQQVLNKRRLALHQTALYADGTPLGILFHDPAKSDI